MTNGPTPSRPTIRIQSHACVDSTNATALSLARDGEPGPVWITARQQTAGRGRRGRNWVSPPGNLYASLLLRDPCAASCAPQLSFVAAVSLHDAVSALTAPRILPLALKWPNDLLLAGAKLAGILVEGESQADGTFVAAIGIGVNCVSHPHDMPYPATALAAAGVAADPAALLATLDEAMRFRLAEWARGDGFSAIRAAWLVRSQPVGEPIRLRTPAETVGAFAGLDEQGRLLLRAADGVLRSFAAGDVAPASETDTPN